MKRETDDDCISCNRAIDLPHYRALVARLRAELRRKDKALRYIHDNTECLLSHETARGALKQPTKRGARGKS